MPRPPRAAGAIALIAALALVACGSDEEANDYVDSVNDIQVALVEDVTSTVSGAPPADPEAAADVADELQGVFTETADELEGITAPERVTDLHGELVAAVRGVGERIGDAKEAFASGNPQQAAAAAQELQTATAGLQTELDALINDINAQLQE